MVKREELKQKVKEKVLLVGDSGTGKTFTCVKVAEFVASHGKQVVFIDNERGAERELELLGDEVLENIELKDTPDWGKMREAIVEEKACYLKVVDGLSAVFSATKFWLEDRYVSHGKYMVGESEIEIKDRQVFSLPWQAYSKVYDALRKACHVLVKQSPHIIVTMSSFGKTETKERLEEDIYRKFDTVMLLRKTQVSMPVPSIKYDAVLRKHRGRPFVAHAVVGDHVEQLKKLFARRMGVEYVEVSHE